jgi:integrase
LPADRHGTVDRLSKSWRARWYDAEGKRQAKAGFRSKTEARDFLHARIAEVEKQQRGVGVRRDGPLTLDQLADEFLAQHVAEDSTLTILKSRLKRARAQFGETRVDRLSLAELRAWRTTLPERSASHYIKALRQVLHYAVAVGVVDDNIATKIPNPQPKRLEVCAFTSLAEVEAVAAEMLEAFRPIPVFAALTGMRPSEWIALERRDIDGDVAHVRRVFTYGKLKPYGKQQGSLRAVPLPARALQALDELAPRIDTPILFPRRTRSDYLDLHSWRRRHWDPAVRAAGLEHRSPYALRHTYASLAIAAGVSLFELSRFMGTSAGQIDATYGHLLPDALDRTRAALDAFLAVDEEQESATR